MTDRIISLDAAIEAIGGNRYTTPPYDDHETGYNNAITDAVEALSALPAVDRFETLHLAMIELNATKDALAEAEAEIAILEGMMHSDDAIHRDLQEARQEAQRLKYENDGPQY